MAITVSTVVMLAARMPTVSVLPVLKVALTIVRVPIDTTVIRAVIVMGIHPCELVPLVISVPVVELA